MRDVVAMLTTCCLVALAKPGYIPIVALFFLIPRDRFRSRTRQFGLFALLSVATVGVTVIWSNVGGVVEQLQPIANKASAFEVFPDPARQLQFIASDWANFIGIMLHSLATQFEVLRQHFIGVLGWLDVPLPQASVDFGCGVLLFLALRDSRADVNLSLRSKAILAIYVIATATLIMTSLFLTWSPVGGAQISGLQGRYFFPVAPAAFAVLYNRRLGWLGRDQDLRWIAVASVLILFATAVVALIHRYYDG